MRTKLVSAIRWVQNARGIVSGFHTWFPVGGYDRARYIIHLTATEKLYHQGEHLKPSRNQSGGFNFFSHRIPQIKHVCKCVHVYYFKWLEFYGSMMDLAGMFSALKNVLHCPGNLVPEGGWCVKHWLWLNIRKPKHACHKNRVPSSHCLRWRAEPAILVRHGNTLNIHGTMWHKHETYAVAAHTDYGLKTIIFGRANDPKFKLNEREIVNGNGSNATLKFVYVK